MMQITVKDIAIKRGNKDGRDWSLTTITPTEGRKWSGFSEGLEHLKSGDVIEITEYEEGSGNNLNKIIKYKKVSEGAPASAPGSTGKAPDMSKEDWAIKQRVERASFEAQTAVKTILSLDPAILKTKEAKKVYELALAWCEEKIYRNMKGQTPAAKPDTITKPAPEPKAETEESTTETMHGWPPLSNVGDIYTRAKKYGLSPRDVCSAAGVNTADEITDLNQAWLAVAKKFASKVKAPEQSSTDLSFD